MALLALLCLMREKRCLVSWMCSDPPRAWMGCSVHAGLPQKPLPHRQLHRKSLRLAFLGLVFLPQSCCSRCASSVTNNGDGSRKCRIVLELAEQSAVAVLLVFAGRETKDAYGCCFCAKAIRLQQGVTDMHQCNHSPQTAVCCGCFHWLFVGGAWIQSLLLRVANALLLQPQTGCRNVSRVAGVWNQLLQTDV